MDELLKHDLSEAFYYMHLPNLIIKLSIAEVVVSDNGVTLELGTDGNSTLTIWKEASEIVKVRRPDNIIGVFEYCYLIKNEYKEPIGYIGK